MIFVEISAAAAAAAGPLCSPGGGRESGAQSHRGSGTESTLYTAHYVVHTVHCTLHIAHCTLHTAHYILHTAHCTVHTVHCTLYTVHCTLHISPGKVRPTGGRGGLSDQSALMGE